MSTTVEEYVRTSIPRPGVALVTLSRGPVNAFHQAFWEELGRTFKRIGRDGDVRAIVLSSAFSKYFTAGLDLKSSDIGKDGTITDPSRRARLIRDHILHFQSCISAIEETPQPVIAAVDGIAFGLAIDILSACDIRYAATSAVFSVKEVDVGLAADIGTLARLPKAAGNQSAIRELAYTARNFGPEEAERIGFVSRVVKGGHEAVLRAALDTATLIASKSPIAVVGTKHLLLHARDHSVRQNLEYTATWNAANLQTSDFTEALSSFKTKRPPIFAPLPKL